MAAVEPFFREAGTGPGVVCFHANASSSTQWRELMELLAPRCHVLATDGYGAGKSPPWPADRIAPSTMKSTWPNPCWPERARRGC